MSVTEIAGDMGSRVRTDIRVWAEGVEEAMMDDRGDCGGTDMREAGEPACQILTCFRSVSQLKLTVSEAGVKSGRVTLTGRYALHKIEKRLEQLEDCESKKKLAEIYKSLKQLLHRQQHEDSTDEVTVIVGLCRDCLSVQMSDTEVRRGKRGVR